jgi:hypothetical protein
MRTSTILTINILLIAFSGNASAHAGPHNDNWIQTAIHFATSPDHLPFIIPTVIILGLAVRGILSARQSFQKNDSTPYSDQ